MRIKYGLLVLSLFVANQIVAQNWEIKESYKVAFSGKKAEGTFRGLEGVIKFDPRDPETALFQVVLDVGTIETGNNTKNKHARNENWFFVKSFPKIRFTSNRVIKTAEGYLMQGELDLRGIQKEVEFPFTFSESGGEGIFLGTLFVNRKDFGIKGNFMEFLVGDQFSVEIEVPVFRQNP